MGQPTEVTEVQSPCVKRCALDEEKMCQGCKRTLEEIRNWLKMSNDEKQQVLIAIQERKKVGDHYADGVSTS